MITRISEIRGVGSLKNMRPDKGGEYGLTQKTVVYAPNATGKTTLAAVLKSYGFDAPVLIDSRTTLSSQRAPFALLDVDNEPRRFQDGKWQSNQGEAYEFATFDHAYIEENVFSSEVTTDHLKTIHRVVIGPEGKGLNDALEQAKERERKARRELQDRQKQLEERKAKTGRIDYLELPSTTTLRDAEAHAEECHGRLKALKDAAAIATLATPNPSSFALGDFGGLRRAVSATFAVAHAEARQRVKERIRTVLRSASDAESFLETGLRLRPSDGQCPFCGQDTAPASDMLTDYEKHFDDAYAATKKDVVDRVKRFSQWSPVEHLRKWQTERAQSSTLREKWAVLIPDLPSFPDSDSEIEVMIAKASALHANARTELEKKTLSLDIEPDLKPLGELESVMQRLKAEADRDAQVCGVIAERIALFRQKIHSSDVGETEKELARLRAIADALRPEADIWRKQYGDARGIAEKETKTREVAEKALETHCLKTYEAFQRGVNSILSDFQLRFTLNGLEPRSTQQSSQVSADVFFGVDGCPVSASKRQISEPCFRNTLSEGEKSALAFAFFLTDLQRRNNLNKVIVVIDDPLSSFDDGRREATANRLAKLSTKCRQLIVLTHRMDFVGILFDQPNFDGRFMQLTVDTLQGTCFKPLDVKEVQRSTYDKNIYALDSFFRTGELPIGNSVQGQIRYILEYALRIKYCRTLQGERELTAIIKRLRGNARLQQDVDEELEYLNKRSQIGLHAPPSEDQSLLLTPPELQQLARRALDMLERI